MRGAFWWIDRWRQSRAYTDMTAEEQGLARNLWDELWLRDDHVIPDDQRILAKVSGDPVAWARSGANVLKWMKRVKGGWTHDVALEVIEESKKRADKQKRYRDSRRNQPGNGGGNDSGNPAPSLRSVSVHLDKELEPEPDRKTKPPADCPGFTAAREADLDAPAPEDVRRELLRLAAEGAASPWGGGKSAEELIQAASMVGDSCIDNVYSPYLKRSWVEATVSKLRQQRAVWAAKNRIEAPNPAEQWVEANGGRDKLARECAAACGWSDVAAPRAAWREKRGAPEGVAALLHWPIARAIEAHKAQVTA